MSITKKLFGKLADGREVWMFSLVNKNNMQADIINYGANLVNLLVPGQSGERVDVNLGYDTVEEYTVNDGYFGTVVAPNCNRIDGGRFEIDGKTIQMPINDTLNNLHTSDDATQKQLWDAKEEGDALVLTIRVPDGLAGLPGNKDIKLTYSLSDDNELKLHYEITSDAKTIINPTNHSYFNLDGHAAGLIHDHYLWMDSDAITELSLQKKIPTGEILPVAGTAFDFRKAKKIGQDIANDEAQLTLVGGYDHNWILNGYDGHTVRLVAKLMSKEANRTMEVYTDLPGIQIYAGNFISTQRGKGGATYSKRMGIAMETQFYPDAPNHPNFPSTVYDAGQTYESTTIYRIIDGVDLP